MKYLLLLVMTVSSCSRTIDITTINRAIELCRDSGGLYEIDTFGPDSAVCVKRVKSKHRVIR